MAEKGFWNSQVVSAVIGSVATYILSKLDTIKTNWAWEWIPGWASAVSNWFTKPFISPMHALLAVFGLVILRRVYTALTYAMAEAPSTPNFLQYCGDRIDGMQWRWRWVKSGSAYDVDRIQALCPRCKYPMVWTQSSYHLLGYNSLHCEECKHTQQLDHEKQEVENRIRRRINYVLENNAIPKQTQ